MAVLIKDMEMPGSCGECKMHFLGEPNYVCCSITDRIPKIVGKYYNSKIDLDTRIASINTVQKPDWCPLIEIPAPHGRLIDADKLRKKFEELHAYSWVLRNIDNAPTIIPATEEET